MAQSTLSMRVDNTLKRKFDEICDDFGLTSTAAITVFMKTVVRDRKIPFEIKASERTEVNANGWEAFLKLREQAAASGVQELSLDEINAIIKEVRDAK